MDALYQFAGRLHPLVLHAPIGLVIGLVMLELTGLARRRPIARDVRATFAWLTALSAVAAVATGLILQEEGGYDNLTVQLHQWLAIAVGVTALAAAVLQQIGRTAWYGACLALTAGVLAPAGHFGASMTHGSNFLFEPFEPAPEPPVLPLNITTPDGATTAATNHSNTYTTIIAPILESRCVSCHGAERDKGGLRLHTPEAIMAGGELGPVLVAGDASASILTLRMRLDIDHDDRMPPKSKPQPADAEIAAIEAWIAAGASFATPTADSTTPPTAAAVPMPDAAPQQPIGPPPASAATILAIKDRLVHVEPIARGSNLLLVDTSAVSPSIDDAALAALIEPVREQVADLTVARSRITDASIDLIAALPNLRRVNLSATAVTDAGVERLSRSTTLTELVLTQTSVSDLSYDAFVSMPALARLYLWKSRVSRETVAELREEMPYAIIDAGDTASAEKLTEETEIKLTSDGPAAPSAAGANPDALKPVNALCPVLDQPIDPKYAIVHKGKVIGFCCRHCLAKFVEEPEKFEAKVNNPRP